MEKSFSIQNIKESFFACFLAVFYFLMSRFWRFRHVRRPDNFKNVVYAHWHGDELLLIGAFIGKNMGVMTSYSRDGELMKKMLSILGFKVVRGSTTRGGVGGLKGLIDLVKSGYSASLAVDGPRGPIYKVKSGILKLAQQTQTPLIPGAAASNRKYIFEKAWNKCYLPLPFSKCVIVYGEPIHVPVEINEYEFEKLRFELEQKLTSLKLEAESIVREEDAGA